MKIRFNRQWRQYNEGDTANLDSGIANTLIERTIASPVKNTKPQSNRAITTSQNQLAQK